MRFCFLCGYCGVGLDEVVGYYGLDKVILLRGDFAGVLLFCGCVCDFCVVK